MADCCGLKPAMDGGFGTSDIWDGSRNSGTLVADPRQTRSIEEIPARKLRS